MSSLGELRTDFTEAPLKNRVSRYHAGILAAAATVAILFQVYVPRFVDALAYLELPLLITVYFSLMRRSPVMGVGFGMAIGLAQDSLSHNPLGMFGVVKTLVGYFSAVASQRFNVDNPGVRFALGLFFFFFHQFFYWVLASAVLGQTLTFDPVRTLVIAGLNAVVAVPLFHILDKLKMTA